MPRDRSEADYNTEAPVRPRIRTVSPQEPCPEPVTRVSASGTKTRVTITNAKDAKPGRTRSPIYVPHSSGSRRPARSSYNRVYTLPRNRTSETTADDRLTREYESKGREGDDQERYDSEDEELLPDLDGELSGLNFDFTFSASGEKTNSDSSDVNPTVASALGSALGGAIAETAIERSTWLGTALDEWSFGAELFVSSSRSTKRKPAIRWLHLERSLMTFEEFVAVTRSAMDCPQEDKRHVEGVLLKAQKEHEMQRQRGREMEPFCIGDVDYQDAGPQEMRTSSICFLSFPSFSLEQGSGDRIKALPFGSPEHPSTPLVQVQTRTANERRELAQAIASLSTTKKGAYLHVANVWCLIVNEALIITCSKASLKELQQDAIIHSPAEDGGSYTIVKVGSARSWQIPRSLSLSLPSTVSYFTDNLSEMMGFDPDAVFMRQTRVLDSVTWQGALSHDTRSNVEIRLEKPVNSNLKANMAKTMQEAREAFCPVSEKYQPGITSTPSDEKESTVSSIQVTGSRTKFAEAAEIGHIKIFLYASNESNATLSQVSDAMSNTLAENIQSALKDSYATCPEASRADVQAWLATFAGDTSFKSPQSGTAIGKTLASRKEWIALLSEYVFGFFFPLDFDHLLTRKFWGALENLLQATTFYGHGAEDVEYDRQMAGEFLALLLKDLVPYIASLSKAFYGHESKTPCAPDHFFRAWLHIISAFVLASEIKFKRSRRRAWRMPLEQLISAGKQLEGGERAITITLRNGVDISKYEVCSSRGLVALVLDRLSNDLIHRGPNVSQVYADYCQQLEAKMLGDPLNRSHQVTIRALHQELEAVTSTLTSQLDVVNVFERTNQQLDGGTELPNLQIVRENRQDDLIAQTKATISSRIDQFKALQNRTTDLGDWHLAEIDTNKDRQEAAIMVFTVVTLIFLPLSFVASVFGMSTSDIRDMSQGQWLYWAVAIPVTVVVAGGSLWWTGMFGDLGAWLSRPATSLRSESLSPRGKNKAVAPEVREAPTRLPPAASRRRTTYPVKRG
ncbi:uncharacterized protein MYCFIDRAFT_213846 [Pseudocercospora fijiensis CIRAD86]|uniref:Mg2+ transporter protein, CorA-like/Zinc transport protein ZntB n=1 Tax=Pseudocercospora fijiensis (strain CIRAD86) TaxID=383855 RepID=M2Z6K3_PSEFD|nr:uncharacterized protein MYCFIDRAFT_213846 [Pseudocercospora fijiensis CIRAD86]EME85400.1 hypothetical protein MYCFIDRAFT_213846 [Pseudocercospora fijiensis CIRAD86]